MECIFCDILEGKRKAHFIYEDADHVVILDRYPIDIGHSLVIPKKHYETITEMPDHKVGALFTVVPKIAKAILQGIGADAFSLGQNNGRAAKQIIPHVHVHIIPRFNHKGTVWTKRTISNDDELSTLAQKIKRHVVSSN